MGDARTAVFLCNVRDDPGREQQLVDSLLSKRVDGLIITGTRLTPRPPVDVGSTGLPIVDMELERLGLIDGQVERGLIYRPCSLACRASCGGRDCSPAPDPDERLTRW